MGKYTKLRGKFTAFLPEPSYQEKVEKAKQAYLGKPMADLGEVYFERKAQKDSLEDSVKAVGIEVEALAQLLTERMLDAGIQKFTLEGGGTLSVNPEPYASVKNQQALLTWLRGHKLTSMLTVNWQTLNAFVKDRLINGEPLPAGVEVFLKEKIHRSGGGKGDENGEGTE